MVTLFITLVTKSHDPLSKTVGFLSEGAVSRRGSRGSTARPAKPQGLCRSFGLGLSRRV